MEEIISHRLCNLPPGKSGVYHKLGEIHLDPDKGNRFPRSHNKQSIHDHDSTSGESGQTDFFVSNSTEHKRSIFRVFQASLANIVATSPAVIPARLQARYLMMWQIQGLKYSSSHTSKTQLDNLSRKELEWWIENLKINKGKSILTRQPDMIMQTDGSLAGWGVHCQGMRTGGAWTQEENSFHINVLELKAVYLGLLTCTTNKKPSHIHFQIDNTCAKAYLLKTRSRRMTDIAKKIWEYLLQYEITITDEYLPSALNQIADWESRHVKDSTEWKLDPNIYSRSPRDRSVCFQAIQPIATVHESQTGSIQPSYRCDATGLVSQIHVCFPTIQHGGASTQENSGRPMSTSDNHSCLGNTAMVPSTPSSVNRTPSLDSKQEGSAEESTGRTSPTPFECFPDIRGLAGFRKRLVSEGVPKRAAQLISNARSEGTKSNYESAWTAFNSWCGRRKINPFQSPIQAVLDFLADLFDQGLEYRTIGCYRSAISAYPSHTTL